MNWLSSLFQNGGNALKGLFGGGAKAAAGAGNSLGGSMASAFPKTGGGIFSSFNNPSAKIGLATMAGSQLLRSPKVPQLPQSAQNYQQMATQGTDIGNLANSRLTEMLNTPYQQVSQDEENAALRGINLQKDQEMRGLTGMYKSLRPGTDPTTDTTYQRDLGQLNDRYATLQGDTLAQLHRQSYNDFTGQRAQQVAQANGLSSQQLQQLSQMSQLDIDRQLAQLGMDYTDQQTLRNYLLQIGGNLFSQGVNPQQNWLQQLFGGGAHA